MSGLFRVWVLIGLVGVGAVGLAGCCTARGGAAAGSGGGQGEAPHEADGGEGVVDVVTGPADGGEPSSEATGLAEVGDVPLGGACGPGFGRCDGETFCRFPDESPCGDGGVAGVCEARPRACTRDCPGVCGCEGQRFCNVCVAHARGFSTRHAGRCAEPAP